jgi:hypothetical protein
MIQETKEKMAINNWQAGTGKTKDQTITSALHKSFASIVSHP